jgi:hypothetical protein
LGRSVALIGCMAQQFDCPCVVLNNAATLSPLTGWLAGVLASRSVPLTLVPPVRWKRALGVSKDKDGCRARASQLLPKAAHQWPLRKHDGRAEAALIALYGARELAGSAAVPADIFVLAVPPEVSRSNAN